MTNKDFNFGVGSTHGFGRGAETDEVEPTYTPAEAVAIHAAQEELRQSGIAHEVGDFVSRHQLPEASHAYESLHKQDLEGNYVYDGSELHQPAMDVSALDPKPPVAKVA